MKPTQPPNQSILRVPSIGHKGPGMKLINHFHPRPSLSTALLPTNNFMACTQIQPTYACCTICTIHGCGHEQLYSLMPWNGVVEKLTVTQVVTKISCLLHNQKVQSHFHTGPSYPKPDGASSHPPPNPLSLRSTLILPCHVCVGL